MAFIDKTIEVAADIRDVYEAWTAFEDFPEFMETVETVTIVQDDRLHWVAVVEDDTFEWDADVVEHVPDEKVTWRAVDGRETGEVRFEKLAADSTKVTYQLEYDPSAWEAKADAVRRWMDRRVDEDLEAFKEVVEAFD
ncbi:MAG TPA: SRPBCC family protein [Thermoleophilia bacterium]|nr:SRPBCC family protein [Thermoleophilia bacterium]